jgi:hypothetical protein
MKVNDWQKDLLEERKDLAKRIAFYTNAMVKDEILEIGFENANALFAQLSWMIGYHSALVARISKFTKSVDCDLTSRIALYNEKSD